MMMIKNLVELDALATQFEALAIKFYSIFFLNKPIDCFNGAVGLLIYFLELSKKATSLVDFFYIRVLVTTF